LNYSGTLFPDYIEDKILSEDEGKRRWQRNGRVSMLLRKQIRNWHIKVSVQVHTHWETKFRIHKETTCKIVILCILAFKFL